MAAFLLWLDAQRKAFCLTVQTLRTEKSPIVQAPTPTPRGIWSSSTYVCLTLRNLPRRVHLKSSPLNAMFMPMPTSPGSYGYRAFDTLTSRKELIMDHSGPAIPFNVGTDTRGYKVFNIHLSVLAEYSTFFHDIHNNCNLIEADTLKFDLCGTDPQAFNRFTIWLYYQVIYIDEGITMPLEYYAQFEQLWMLADKYRIPSLQKQSVDTALVLLRELREHSNFDVLGYWHCIYHNTYVGSPERRFIAGQCATLLLSGQEKSLDPENVHPALRGDIVNAIHNLYPQLY